MMSVIDRFGSFEKWAKHVKKAQLRQVKKAYEASGYSFPPKPLGKREMNKPKKWVKKRKD